MLGIGIDTGGTCTDAVIYEIDENKILAWAKDLTTKEDLKLGIIRAIKKLPQELVRECKQIALSTTLATNACVENLGGNGKLIFIGVDEDILRETYASYGFESLDDIYLLKCRVTNKPATSELPDWDAFREEMREFLDDCECVSIVQLFAAEHMGSYEDRAAEIIREIADIPIIKGKDLFPDRNAIRRGTGALLNARLVPVIYRFVQAIQEVFSSMNLDVPTTIIRSDGSQMSRDFAMLRPVETLLSGPAASVVGGITLTDAEDAMIVDMGGTTTDIAVVKNHIAKRAENGIQIGDWKTFVKGLYVDTFGLGGDTAIHYGYNGDVYLENYRVIPLCSLAARYPEVLTELDRLDRVEYSNPSFLYEFLYLLKDIEGDSHYDGDEVELCRQLKGGPLSLCAVSGRMKRDIYIIKKIMSNLEAKGVLIRSGLTPTDIMHIRGDYNEYCGEASLHAARFVARSSNIAFSPQLEEGKKNDGVEELCGKVYDLIDERLYENIVRILLTTEGGKLKNKDLDGQTRDLIAHSFALAKQWVPEKDNSFAQPFFRLRMKLVGVGAPMHVFLPRVAALLGTEAVLPEYAQVANAVGAIAGQVIVSGEVTIYPPEMGRRTYQVVTLHETEQFKSYEEARAYAEETGEREIREKAYRQGALGELNVTLDVVHDEVKARYSSVWVADILRYTAIGNPVLRS